MSAQFVCQGKISCPLSYLTLGAHAHRGLKTDLTETVLSLCPASMSVWIRKLAPYRANAGVISG